MMCQTSIAFPMKAMHWALKRHFYLSVSQIIAWWVPQVQSS